MVGMAARSAVSDMRAISNLDVVDRGVVVHTICRSVGQIFTHGEGNALTSFEPALPYGASKLTLAKPKMKTAISDVLLLKWKHSVPWGPA